MRLPRSSGLLLHPTSLPGQYGIGDLGPEAYRFADFLESAGQRIWQVLPLGPTGYGDSPYQSYSAFAGNPLLVSLERLVEDGLLQTRDLKQAPAFPHDYVDFNTVIPFHSKLIDKAARNFSQAKKHPDRDAFDQFCLENISWLSDYALYMAARRALGETPWNQWDADLRAREQDALHEWGTQLHAEIFSLKFGQFEFFKQWNALRSYCNDHGIRLMGDIPIYVAHDSADVWANPHLFELDKTGAPTVVAGVPPDYFSATGQLWGNPLFRWDRAAADGYAWWIARIAATMKMVGIVRIDHFRGFESYWEVPADAPDATTGQWVPGPGDAFFDAVRSRLGEVPIVAEDLGIITEAVEALRLRHHLPGMAVLQFAFGEDAASSGLLPHKWNANTVAYTGTHDNDTTVGWWHESGEHTTLDKAVLKRQRAYALRYLNSDGADIHWDCIRAVMASVADTAIFPLQDVLGLDASARMNRPGSVGGTNWRWRVMPGAVNAEHARRLRDLAEIYERLV